MCIQKRISKHLPSILFIAFLLAVPCGFKAKAHCEIPCGIYNDKLRTDLLAEDAGTISKCMTEIKKLSAEKPLNFNQLVRWINNKELHAEKFQQIVWQYFLTQRIKAPSEKSGPEYEKYVHETILLQQMLVYAMKCKQTTDPVNVNKLFRLLDEFKKSYFGGDNTHRH